MGYDSSEDRAERLVGTLFLVTIALLTVLDIIEDVREGSTLAHVITELVIVSCSLIGAVYLWRKIVGGLVKRNVGLKDQLSQAHQDIAHWREETASLSKGLCEAIDRQLTLWGLSPAEKEVAFLLLKGLSFKELAEVRGTSERTVRQQAAVIYQKSKLEGRAQLSAFFLEDLLVANDK